MGRTPTRMGFLRRDVSCVAIATAIALVAMAQLSTATFTYKFSDREDWVSHDPDWDDSGDSHLTESKAIDPIYGHHTTYPLKLKHEHPSYTAEEEMRVMHEGDLGTAFGSLLEEGEGDEEDSEGDARFLDHFIHPILDAYAHGVANIQRQQQEQQKNNGPVGNDDESFDFSFDATMSRLRNAPQALHKWYADEDATWNTELRNWRTAHRREVRERQRREQEQDQHADPIREGAEDDAVLLEEDAYATAEEAEAIAAAEELRRRREKEHKFTNALMDLLLPKLQAHLEKVAPKSSSSRSSTKSGMEDGDDDDDDDDEEYKDPEKEHEQVHEALVLLQRETIARVVARGRNMKKTNKHVVGDLGKVMASSKMPKKKKKKKGKPKKPTTVLFEALDDEKMEARRMWCESFLKKINRKGPLLDDAFCPPETVQGVAPAIKGISDAGLQKRVTCTSKKAWAAEDDELFCLAMCTDVGKKNIFARAKAAVKEAGGASEYTTDWAVQADKMAKQHCGMFSEENLKDPDPVAEMMHVNADLIRLKSTTRKRLGLKCHHNCMYFLHDEQAQCGPPLDVDTGKNKDKSANNNGVFQAGFASAEESSGYCPSKDAVAKGLNRVDLRGPGVVVRANYDQSEPEKGPVSYWVHFDDRTPGGGKGVDNYCVPTNAVELDAINEWEKKSSGAYPDRGVLCDLPGVTSAYKAYKARLPPDDTGTEDFGPCPYAQAVAGADPGGKGGMGDGTNGPIAVPMHCYQFGPYGGDEPLWEREEDERKRNQNPGTTTTATTTATATHPVVPGALLQEQTKTRQRLERTDQKKGYWRYRGMRGMRLRRPSKVDTDTDMERALDLPHAAQEVEAKQTAQTTTFTSAPPVSPPVSPPVRPVAFLQQPADMFGKSSSDEEESPLDGPLLSQCEVSTCGSMLPGGNDPNSESFSVRSMVLTYRGPQAGYTYAQNEGNLAPGGGSEACVWAHHDYLMEPDDRPDAEFLVAKSKSWGFQNEHLWYGAGARVMVTGQESRGTSIKRLFKDILKDLFDVAKKTKGLMDALRGFITFIKYIIKYPIPVSLMDLAKIAANPLPGLGFNCQPIGPCLKGIMKVGKALLDLVVAVVAALVKAILRMVALVIRAIMPAKAWAAIEGAARVAEKLAAPAGKKAKKLFSKIKKVGKFVGKTLVQALTLGKVSGDTEDVYGLTKTKEGTTRAGETCARCNLRLCIGVKFGWGEIVKASLTAATGGLNIGVSFVLTTMPEGLMQWMKPTPPGVPRSKPFAQCRSCMKKVWEAFKFGNQVQKFWTRTCNPLNVGMCMLIARTEVCRGGDFAYKEEPDDGTTPWGKEMVEQSTCGIFEGLDMYAFRDENGVLDCIRRKYKESEDAPKWGRKTNKMTAPWVPVPAVEGKAAFDPNMDAHAAIADDAQTTTTTTATSKPQPVAPEVGGGGGGDDGGAAAGGDDGAAGGGGGAGGEAGPSGQVVDPTATKPSPQAHSMLELEESEDRKEGDHGIFKRLKEKAKKARKAVAKKAKSVKKALSKKGLKKLKERISHRVKKNWDPASAGGEHLDLEEGCKMVEKEVKKAIVSMYTLKPEKKNGCSFVSPNMEDIQKDCAMIFGCPAEASDPFLGIVGTKLKQRAEVRKRISLPPENLKNVLTDIIGRVNTHEGGEGMSTSAAVFAIKSFLDAAINQETKQMTELTAAASRCTDGKYTGPGRETSLLFGHQVFDDRCIFDTDDEKSEFPFNFFRGSSGQPFGEKWNDPWSVTKAHYPNAMSALFDVHMGYGERAVERLNENWEMNHWCCDGKSGLYRTVHDGSDDGLGAWCCEKERLKNGIPVVRKWQAWRCGWEFEDEPVEHQSPDDEHGGAAGRKGDFTCSLDLKVEDYFTQKKAYASACELRYLNYKFQSEVSTCDPSSKGDFIAEEIRDELALPEKEIEEFKETCRLQGVVDIGPVGLTENAKSVLSLLEKSNSPPKKKDSAASATPASIAGRKGAQDALSGQVAGQVAGPPATPAQAPQEAPKAPSK